MLRIITTVGVSLFSNLDNTFDVCIREILSSLKKEMGYKWEVYGGNDTEGADSDIASIRAFCAKTGFQSHFSDAECSAETSTLEEIIKETGCGDDYEVYLLCTDTVLSRLAAELLATYNPLLQGKTYIINRDGISVGVSGGKVIPKLSIHDAKDLKTVGLANLIAEIQAIWRLRFDCAGYTSHSFVINASGGYKGIIPFLTLIAQLYDISMYYKYQEENEKTREQYKKKERDYEKKQKHLIKIDALPIGYDWELIYEVGEYLCEEKINDDSKDDDKKKVILKELEKMNCVERIDRHYTLTDVGAMLRAFYEGAKVAMIEEVDRYTPAGAIRTTAAANLAEFKFFEWRAMTSYKSHDKMYPLVSRSSGSDKLRLKNHQELFDSQIDIAMESVDGKGFILGEVKYAYWIENELALKHKELENPHAYKHDVRRTAQGIGDKILHQILKRLGECESLPDEFHVYAYSAFPMNEDDQKVLVVRINRIDQELKRNERYSNVILRVFYCPIGANPKTIADFSLDEINKTKLIYSSESHS